MLKDLIPKPAHRWVHLAALIFSISYAAWQASNGEVVSIFVGLAAALISSFGQTKGSEDITDLVWPEEDIENGVTDNG